MLSGVMLLACGLIRLGACKRHSLCKVCGNELLPGEHVITVGESIPGTSDPRDTVFGFKAHGDCLSDEVIQNIIHVNERI